MKKILVVCFVFFMFVSPVFAKKQTDEHYIKFGGEKFRLLYSSKNPETGGFLNEYYTKGETYNIWSELIGIHHFPNAYSPIDQVKAFREYLGSLNCPSALTFDDKKNTALIDFIMISNNKIPVVMEFYIFKYQKSKKCGSVALQYARRYSAVTAFQVEQVKRDIEKSRKKYLKKVKKYPIPLVITEEIDKCKIGIEETNTVEKIDNQVKQEEIIQSENEIKDQDISEQEKELPVNNLESEQNAVVNDEKPESTENAPTEESQIEDAKAGNKEVENSDTNTDLTEIEKIQKTDSEELNLTENDAAKEDNTEEKIPLKQVETEDDSNIIPVNETVPPQQNIENEIKNAPIPQEHNASKEKQVTKSKNKKRYKVVNDKDDYIIKPPTKKEIKQRIKAEKQKKKTYTLVNNKDEYIAKPLTKKQIKAQVKEARKRAKRATKSLNESL